RLLRQFRTHRAASLGPPNGTPASLPAVAIIVPARNEIANIGTCLAGLTAQRGLSGGLSIIVVDDGSQDGTGEVVARSARDDPRIELIGSGDLPAGWMGKPHACWQGALQTDAEWLCFVDADVRATPDLVAAAVVAALRQGIDMLSLNPRQELGSFWERLIIPAGLVLIGCAQDLRPIDDPASTEILGDGLSTVRAATAGLVIGWAAILLPILTGISAAQESSTPAMIGAALGLLGSTAVIGIQIGTARHFKISPLFGLLFPFAYT